MRLYPPHVLMPEIIFYRNNNGTALVQLHKHTKPHGTVCKDNNHNSVYTSMKQFKIMQIFIRFEINESHRIIYKYLDQFTLNFEKL